MKTPPKVSERSPSKAPPRAIRREFYTTSDFEGALNEAMTTGQSIDLALSAIRPSPYQSRAIRSEHLNELIANISANGLITPVLVRQLEHGVFELIAGHHRVRAFQELGKEKIPSIVVKLEDGAASAAVFYDNLHGPNLTDYEKYIGLQQRVDETGFSQAELATESGISKAQISRLFAYGALPKESLTMLSKYPEKLGANAAEALREYAENGKGKLVTQAIEKLVAGEIEQKNAVPWIRSQENGLQLASKKKSPVQIYNSGKKLFCSIQQADKSLRIAFGTIDDANELQNILEETIRNFLKEKHRS